jgi:hypothetical protein
LAVGAQEHDTDVTGSSFKVEVMCNLWGTK